MSNLIISSLANAIYQLGEEEMLDDNNYFISTHREANSVLAFVPELNLVKSIKIPIKLNKTFLLKIFKGKRCCLIRVSVGDRN